MKEFIEKEIEEQKEMLNANIGETEKYAVRYCILCLEDILKKLVKD